MKAKINKLQLIQFELMEHVSLEGFDARRIINDLITHRDLWEAVIMMPDPNWSLLHLRDLSENKWNVDCLYIYASGEDLGPLNDLVIPWMAKELLWLDAHEQMHMMRVPEELPKRVLRLFW